jgi:hypothetical protein
MNRKFTLLIVLAAVSSAKWAYTIKVEYQNFSCHVIYKSAFPTFFQTSPSPSSITLTQAAILKASHFQPLPPFGCRSYQRHTLRFEERASTWRKHDSQPRSFATSASISGFASRPLVCRSVPMPINVPTDDLQRYLRRRPSSRSGARCTAIKIILAKIFPVSLVMNR